MKTIIKMIGFGAVAFLGVLMNTSVAFAAATSCTTATLNGQVTQTNGVATNVWFEWGTNQTSVNSGLGAKTQTQVFTAPSFFSQPLSGLTENTIYYYRAVFSNIYGTSNGGVLSLTTPLCQTTQPTVTISADQTNVSYNNGTYLRWYPNNATSCFANGGTNGWSGTQNSVSGSFYTGALTNTTTYSITCSNNSGSTSASVTVWVGAGTNYTNTYNTYGTAPAATTLLATELTGNTARLNGLVFTSASQSSNTWFEWGESSSLGNSSTVINVGALPVVKHDTILSGLVSGRTYYYRIVAENTYGKIYGTIMSFVSETPVVQDTTTVISQPVTRTVTVVARGASTQSLASLAIDGGAETIANGEKRSYHITWKNTNGGALKNVVVRVTLPTSMSFESATNGSYSSADNTITVGVGALEVGATGDMLVSATTNNNVTQGQLIVVTANMVYTSASNVQGDVVAYVTHTVVRAQNGLGANLFGAGPFLPTTLFEWMILIILVLILVLLGNHLYGRFSGEVH